MPELSPDEVAAHAFPSSFRGFDATEVKTFLARVAEQLRAAQDEAEELRRRLADAEERAAHPQMDVDTITSALGDETARILRSAQDAAADIRGKAEDNVAQLLREAYEEAAKVRADAESVLARETEEAEAAAAGIRASADADAAAALGRARQEAERLLADVEGKARAMVEEAESRRTKVLGDLARRRKLAHTQVEQLRAGRDRLLEAYRMVRTTLDEVTEELLKAESEARAAAEAAARRVPEEQADDVAEPEPEPEPAPQSEPEVQPEAGAEPEAQPAPEPAAALSPAPSPQPAPEERRRSSVRIIRRPKADEDAEADRPGFTPVAPPTAGEGVRIIKPDPVEGDDSPATTAAGSSPEPPAAVAEDPPLPEEADEADAPDAVDDLFARIRADRAQEVARAREVLDAPEQEAAAEPEPEAEAEPTEAPAAEAPVSDEDEALLQRRDGVVEDIEHRLARRLKRALQDEQNDLLDRFRSQRGRPAADAVLPAADEHPARYRAVAAELLAEASNAGVAFVEGADATVDVDVDDLADSLAGDLVAPLRKRLERGLEEGADEDASLVVERIGAAYRESKGKRIEQLATDHVIAAFSRGTFTATAEGAPLRWIVDDVGGPCPDCDDNALAGPTPRGEEYPTGRLHPPAHAGCRCLLVPTGP
jgi:DivIVA domain-containing protein